MAASILAGTLRCIAGWVVVVVVVAALGAAAHAAAATPAGPSFDCGRAQGPVEAAICADPQLAARDAAMAQLFELVGVDALASGPSGELEAQKQWLARRDQDCAKAASVGACLAGEYDARLQELAVGALIRAPDAALAELRRQSPAQAALYEAIDKMATLPDGAERTDAVAALLAPEFAKVSQSDQAAALLSPIASARDAAATLGNFAHFIDLTGAVDDPAVTIPCEAIIRRSELLGALDSMFGSSMDNQLGGSDCAAMLPPPPRFAALAATAITVSMSSPDCTGTLRYAGLRDYNELLISIQLDREGARAGPDPDVARRSAAFQRAHRAEMTAGSAELADYYAGTLHAPNPAGAKRAVSEVVDAAFEVCQ